MLAHTSVQLPDQAEERLMEDLPVLEVWVFLTCPEEHRLWKKDGGNKLSFRGSGRRSRASWENWTHQEFMTHCLTRAWGLPRWLTPLSYSLSLSSAALTTNTLLVSHTLLQAEALCLPAYREHGSPHLLDGRDLSTWQPPLSLSASTALTGLCLRLLGAL